ncbi:3-phosphoglycerate dehydrogenase [Candidatus Bathyarchaeota archaeon]|nr:MAG: 3-phosphoglycerate dehydrogenase [Candidatus Bathyarchaeota archaeon]
MRILVCDPIHDEGVRMLMEAGFDVDLETSITGPELVERVKDFDAIVVRSRTKVTREVIEASGRLRAVARAGVGLDNVDLEAAKERGVEVLNSPEAPSNAVAELVLGLMLSLARRIPLGDASMKRGEWIKRRLTGFELEGKTLGIVGFGRIGYNLAKKAKAMGMRVVTDASIEKLMRFVEETGAESVPMEDLLKESDFVSIHVPLLPQTRHMIGARELETMKDGAYLINAARGGVVDEDALREALVRGKLAGAALDVFEIEPPEDTSLTGLENLIALPHIGAATVEAQAANSTIVAEKLIKLFTGD